MLGTEDGIQVLQGRFFFLLFVFFCSVYSVLDKQYTLLAIYSSTEERVKSCYMVFLFSCRFLVTSSRDLVIEFQLNS